jgi:putative salt-induced outer membrane protein YdiY
MKTISLILTLIAYSTLTLAEEALSDVEAKYSNKKKIEATEKLKQSFNLGFSNTTGNTETLNTNAKYDLSFITKGYQDEPLKIAFDASAFLTENNETRSNEEYASNLGLEQIISNGWLGYTGISWLRNPDFRNYENKVGIGIGIGKELYNDGKQLFIAKLGTSYNVKDYANHQKTEEFGALNEYLSYKNQLNKVSQLYLKMGAIQNFDDMRSDYEALAVAGLTLAVSERLNVTLEGEVNYNNIPPVGFEKTDTKTIVRLGYNF